MKRILPALALIVVVLGGLWLWRESMLRSQARSPARYVGGAACAQCHADEARLWAQSDHAHAMLVAGDSTVLGDFRDRTVWDSRLTAHFFRRGSEFWVNTEGPDGQPHDYRVAYTFGWRPLQQYLVAFPGGRLQPLRFAWDARPPASGGQRWYALYPDQRIAPGDPLHWGGRNQNWNYMCARCHSTHLEPNYDPAAKAFDTRWSDLDVACEACHGPASHHVEWARHGARDTANGLVTSLRSPSGSWAVRDSARGIAEWRGAKRTEAVLDACAPCHARAREIAPLEPGHPFLDAFAPATLDSGLYRPDGQIEDEVYEYGSFRQSRMYAAGVTCNDCHDPHSLAPRAAGNALCTRCHLAERFDVESHHHHTAGSEGAQCVNCHMPPRTYMVVDVRRDHSLRLPRPDLTRSVGVPNACASCHGNRPASWAAAAIASWRPGWVPPAHFATAFDSARRELPRSDFALAGMVSDVSQPAIARATALAMLASFPGPAALRAVDAGLADPDAMVRAQAAALTEMLSPDQRVPRAEPLLRDSVRLVRIEAARVLAEAHAGIPAADTAAFHAAFAELLASERLHLERPESHVNLATLEMALGRRTPAERQFAAALALDSLNVPAMVNLADLKRLEARDDEGELWLRRAMRVEPGAAEPVFALALLKVRAGRHEEALDLLRRATAMAPGDARYAYTYGVALNSSGDARHAIEVLRVAQHRHPCDREILNALITLERDRGHVQASAVWAHKLEQLNRR